MPSKWTFDMPCISTLFKRYEVGAHWADPFCGNSKAAEYRNDLAISGLDAHDFLALFPSDEFKGVLFDPPYSMEQVKRSYNSVGITRWQTKYGNNKNGGFPNVKDQIARTLRIGGYAISFGWNSNGMGKARGFKIIEILLIAHGGNRHDTIVCVEKKISVRA